MSPLDDRPDRRDSMRELLRTLTGVLIVIVVFYAGLLLFFISGPPMDDIDNLRKIVRVVLLLGLVASGMLVFLGLPLFSIGPAEESIEEAAAPAPPMDEDAVLLEEYLGLSEEAAAQDADEEGRWEDTEEGHA